MRVHPCISLGFYFLSMELNISKYHVMQSESLLSWMYNHFGALPIIVSELRGQIFPRADGLPGW